MGRDPQRRGGGSGGWIALAALAVFGGLMKATMVLGPVSVPIWFAVIGGGAFVLRGPLGKALAARISGEVPDATGPAELPEELYADCGPGWQSWRSGRTSRSGCWRAARNHRRRCEVAAG